MGAWKLGTQARRAAPVSESTCAAVASASSVQIRGLFIPPAPPRRPTARHASHVLIYDFADAGGFLVTGNYAERHRLDEGAGCNAQSPSTATTVAGEPWPLTTLMLD